MINKKLVGTTLVGLMALGFATQVKAYEETEVDGLEGKTSHEMDVQGLLGDPTNTDPETPLPEEDDRWINVVLPTKVLFETNSSGTIETIVDYKIQNNSGRGVNVSVDEYRFDDKTSIDALTSLNIAVPGNAVNLVTDGESTLPKGSNTALATIASKGNTPFEFTGNVDTSKVVKGDSDVKSKLVFKFKAIER